MFLVKVFKNIFNKSMLQDFLFVFDLDKPLSKSIEMFLFILFNIDIES